MSGWLGLDLVTMSLLSSYLAHVRAVEEPHIGSGYVAGYGCHRALQEAFSGLFFSPHERRT